LVDRANESEQDTARRADEPRVSNNSGTKSGGSFLRSFRYYSDYLGPFAIGLGFLVYFADPDIGNTLGWGIVWGLMLALIATLFIVSVILAVKKPVMIDEPRVSQSSAEEAPGFLRIYGRYLLYTGVWFGGVLLLDPDVSLTSGMLMAAGVLALVISLVLTALRPQGPFQD
jgi:hypothetical protein